MCDADQAAALCEKERELQRDLEALYLCRLLSWQGRVDLAVQTGCHDQISELIDKIPVVPGSRAVVADLLLWNAEQLLDFAKFHQTSQDEVHSDVAAAREFAEKAKQLGAVPDKIYQIMDLAAAVDAL